MQLSAYIKPIVMRRFVARPPARPRLAEFIRSHSTEILLAWDEFAATVTHEGRTLDPAALRDHAAQILSAIADDLGRPQTSDEQDAKGKGRAPRGAVLTAAETHADFRMIAGFAVDAMITEYRALRASVLKIWARAGGGTRADDLTDLTRFNEAIDQSIAESVGRYTRQTSTSTDLFIGILGHDIRNPLGTILNSAEVLVRSGRLEAAAAAPIKNAAIRIQGIIEQVVDFTRAQADGLMPITRVPGDLAVQLAKIVQETQVHHPDRKVMLAGSGDFAGSWDEGRMGQLLSNLLGNALVYGARDSTVTVTMSSSASEARFAVHNHGDAIPMSERERIFQPLERGMQQHLAGERRATGGLGLGLYICREIVRAHGGTLELESSQAEGTTFSVTLPRAPA
ncbi:sensor histidine kinase [Ramlibacter sp. XY19]|uniref:sensor histidine kinase n=1 Tax=Ramlibacter paludis TaxID=2908000 RepID=UPI0023D97CC8|nr:sensor histidine kinase [Ramlibacter paludis]MCG2595021.1 sensor histidine kinase [Ramlibacter paludis]